ncbi:hypothetical protein NDU88_002398 [Pleurodeles waltl]|uniref:Uncharacterized protein n=1 Tax=Pleurodeles waltl TaxID=8319 RepID=A0AAV7VZ87_PLEWA|nr:hypothetical protein NDU88_002398 [Pleurodeles waltl]
MHTNPEEEGFCGAPEEERRDAMEVARDIGAEVRGPLEAAGSGRTAESGKESEDAEGAQETEFPAEDEKTPKDAEITRQADECGMLYIEKDPEGCDVIPSHVKQFVTLHDLI